MFRHEAEVGEAEILEFRKKSNKIEDLTVSATRFYETKVLKSRCKVSEILSDAWHKAGYLEFVYSKHPEVRECGEITEGGFVEPLGIELKLSPAYTQPIDKWK